MSKIVHNTLAPICLVVWKATDAIFIPIEKHREGQKDIIVTFIDIEKAYDRVPREEIWRCTRERNVPENYVKLIQDCNHRRGAYS